MEYIYNNELNQRAKHLLFGKKKLTPGLMFTINLVLSTMTTFRKRDRTLMSRKYIIDGYSEKKLKLSIYQDKTENVSKKPVILFFHGGAFMIKAGSHAHKLCEIYAKATGSIVVFVDYHLGPKHPIPCAFEDAWLALQWVHQNHLSLKVDISKIIVTGDSAGGYIAANLAQMAKDRNGPKILFQLLVYPVIAPFANTESMKRFDDTPGWNSHLSHEMFERYFNGENDSYNLMKRDLSRLPEAYIEAHEFDCLRDEAILYASLLNEQGVKAHLETIKGSFHGADIFMKTNFVKALVSKRIVAMNQILNQSD